VTRLLAERWPQARVMGVDASPEMLAKAKAIPGIAWQQADLAAWHAESPADLLYSNAAFHWLDARCSTAWNRPGNPSSSGCTVSDFGLPIRRVLMARRWCRSCASSSWHRRSNRSAG